MNRWIMVLYLKITPVNMGVTSLFKYDYSSPAMNEYALSVANGGQLRTHIESHRYMILLNVIIIMIIITMSLIIITGY